MNRVVNTICVSLMTLFLTACGASKAPIRISHTDTLGDDCEILRNYKSFQGDKFLGSNQVIRVDDEALKLTDLCQNHQLIAMLINAELENPDPEVRAIVNGAALEMITKGSQEFKDSLLTVLKKEYNITEADMIARKELDDAIQAVKDTPEKDCVQLGPSKFYCE